MEMTDVDLSIPSLRLISGRVADKTGYLVPPGTILSFGGATLPGGFLFCDGSAVSRAYYADLFAALGTTWGTGDGSSTFNLPDFRGRSPFGKDDMGGSAASRVTNAISGITGTTLGATGGSQSMQQHNHTISDPGHSHNLYGQNNFSTDGSAVEWVAAVDLRGGGVQANTTGITINNTGSGASQNMPPAGIVNIIIKF